LEKIILNNKHLNNLDKEKPVILAVSGGVDSMVLFSLLKNCEYKIVVAHINHHKRKESDIEEIFIRSLKNDNIIVEVYDYYYEKDNFQADAHNKRYEFFYKLYKKYNASAIITAHHYIDNLETILMNIIKGSNLYGYAGIKEISNYKDATLIRPLIRCDKNDIYNYAKENNITYFEDSSNQEDNYLRNRIRHHIIGNLQLENPNLASSISNYSNQIFEAFDYIRSSSINYLEKNNYKIEISTFNNLALIIKKDIINYICDDLGINSSENKINDILSLIENPKPNLSYSLNDKYHFTKEYNTCYVSKINKTSTINKPINVEEEINIDEYGLFKLTKNNLPGTEILKISPLEPMPLTIRNRKDGDKLIIGQGHKKLKDFLIDKKVPKQERDKLIVVTNNKNEIIWVMGYYKKVCNEENNLNLIFMEK
jgi:tRNA(Ile)-lysidine synthetase-like protein